MPASATCSHEPDDNASAHAEGIDSMTCDCCHRATMRLYVCDECQNGDYLCDECMGVHEAVDAAMNSQKAV